MKLRSPNRVGNVSHDEGVLRTNMFISNASVASSSWTNSNFSGSAFANSKMAKTEFLNCDFSRCTFAGVELHESRIVGSHIGEIAIEDTTFDRILINGVDVTSAIRAELERNG